MVLACFLFMRRMSEVTGVRSVIDESEAGEREMDDPDVILARNVPKDALRRSGLLDEVGPDNVLGTIDLALAVAEQATQAKRKMPSAKTRGSD